MLTNRNLVLAGAGALVVGLFCPIVTLPFVGSVNLFNGGTNFVALVLLGAAVLAAAMALNGRERDAFWPGAAAAAILIYLFIDLQFRLSAIQQSAAELKDNPFGGVAQAAMATVQIQWGWLVLAAGVGVMIYAGLKGRREANVGILSADDGPAKTVALVSVLFAVGTIGWNVYGDHIQSTASPATEAATDDTSAIDNLTGPSSVNATKPSAEEATYIRDNLKLYDLTARYYDTYDGRKPGVNFKIKNNGNRTLDRVEVRVVFKDAQGNPIAEENYTPVLVSEYNISGDNTPLRPNYIWQNESGKFYVADSVPSEWATGQATATITGIEFAPNE